MVSPTITKRVVASTLALVVIGSVALAAPAVAQEDDDEDGDETSQLRIAHAVPDGPDVDVYIDGRRVLEDVSSGFVSDYQSIPAGSHNVVLVATGEPGGVILNADIETEESGNYTLAAAGQQSNSGFENVESVFVTDNATRPNGDIAAVRLVHLAADAPAVTVTLGDTGSVVFENVGFTQASPYMTIPEGDYTLEIRSGGADGEVIQTVQADLDGGEAASLFAFRSDGNETLQVSQVTDPTGRQIVTPDVIPQSNVAPEPQPQDGTENETESRSENATVTPAPTTDGSA